MRRHAKEEEDCHILNGIIMKCIHRGLGNDKGACLGVEGRKKPLVACGVVAFGGSDAHVVGCWMKNAALCRAGAFRSFEQWHKGCVWTTKTFCD